MSTPIALLLAILGRFSSIDFQIILPLQRFSSTLLGQNLLAQTSEPSLFSATESKLR